jgi:hypothetical protein
MSHGTVLNVGAGGDTILDVDLAGFAAYPSTGKLPATCLYVSQTAGVAPTPATAANPVPVGVQGSVPVTAAALPLPAGAATAAKQAAPGAAGTPSADVLTVQGASAGTPVPVSGTVGGYAATPSATFTRPANTTAYASGQLVANNTAAGSVVPLSWAAARVAAGSGMVRRARLKKSGTSVAAATFRLHLYALAPAVTNGDGGAWLTTQSGYLGSFDVDMGGANGRVFSDAAEALGTPSVGAEVAFALASGQNVYGLLEARAAYAPASAEIFTAELEVLQN